MDASAQDPVSVLFSLPLYPPLNGPPVRERECIIPVCVCVCVRAYVSLSISVCMCVYVSTVRVSVQYSRLA
jgi:hypothetical protein